MKKLSMQNQSYKYSVAATNRSDLVDILYMCSNQLISMLLFRCCRVPILFELTSQDHKGGTAQYISRRDLISFRSSWSCCYVSDAGVCGETIHLVEKTMACCRTPCSTGSAINTTGSQPTIQSRLVPTQKPAAVARPACACSIVLLPWRRSVKPTVRRLVSRHQSTTDHVFLSSQFLSYHCHACAA